MRFLPLAVVVLSLLALPLYSAPVQPDSVLIKPVTLDAKGEALVDIIKDMRRQTGLRLSVAKDIADQKATIFVDDKPVGEVMNGLATIFRFQWNRRKYDDKSFSWVLVMSAEERKLRAKLEDGGRAEAMASLDRQMGWLVKAAEMSEKERKFREEELSATYIKLQAICNPTKEDLAKIRETSNEHRVLVDTDSMPPMISAAKTYKSLPAKTIEALWDGMDVYLDSESTEPEWKISDADFRQFLDLDRKWRDLMATQWLDNAPKVDEQSPDALNTMLSLEEDHGEVRVDVTNNTRGRVPFQAGAYSVKMTCSIQPLVRERVNDGVVAGNDLPKLPDADRKLLSDTNVTYSTEELLKEAGIARQPNDGTAAIANLSDILALLHKKAGLQVISDHYSWWSRAGVAKDVSVADIIKDRAEQAPFRRSITGWDGKYLYVRACEYPELDKKEIPNYLLDTWRSAVAESKGVLGLEVYADIAALSEVRRDRFIECRDYLGLGCVDPSPLYDPALKLYGLLSPAQRRRTWIDGMQVSEFGDEQLAQLMSDSMGVGRQSPKLDRIGIYCKGVRIDKHDDSPYPVRVKMKNEGVAAVGVPLAVESDGNVLKPEKDGIGASWDLYKLTVELSGNTDCDRMIQIPTRLEKVGS